VSHINLVCMIHAFSSPEQDPQGIRTRQSYHITFPHQRGIHCIRTVIHFPWWMLLSSNCSLDRDLRAVHSRSATETFSVSPGQRLYSCPWPTQPPHSCLIRDGGGGRVERPLYLLLLVSSFQTGRPFGSDNLGLTVSSPSSQQQKNSNSE